MFARCSSKLLSSSLSSGLRFSRSIGGPLRSVSNLKLTCRRHSSNNTSVMSQLKPSMPKLQSVPNNSAQTGESAMKNIMFPHLMAPRAVGYWMLATSGLVFSIVLLGGLTRLTESGLSMTTWSLTGSPPPQSQEEWQAEFERYKQFPEYKVLNRDMTVEEFKQIFWFEYLHRMLGRVIGLFVILPGLYYVGVKSGRVQCSPAIRKRIGLMSAMVCGQGMLGWYMVKSGLDHQLIEDRKVPRVSQYRLAAHLGSAFVIYLTALTTGLSVLAYNRSLTGVKSLPSLLSLTSRQLNSLPRFKKYSHAITGMVFVTAMSGAFVAGLDAGLIYNTFPMMADRWIPSDLLAFSPLWTNVFENPTTVQFNHRVLAVSTYCAVAALWLYSRRFKGVVGMKPVMNASNILFAIANLQVTLGITTLLWLVPVPLAAAHQSGSLALLTSAFWLQHLLKRIPK